MALWYTCRMCGIREDKDRTEPGKIECLFYCGAPIDDRVSLCADCWKELVKYIGDRREYYELHIVKEKCRYCSRAIEHDDNVSFDDQDGIYHEECMDTLRMKG